MNNSVSAEIAALVEDLGHVAVAADATNQYAHTGPAFNAVRRANLRLALELAHQRGPDLIMVGEAPGYNGARRTGIPFTSEKIMLDGVAELAMFGAARGFQRATDDGRTSSEQTASIAHRQLIGLNRYVVGWNTFPFHPHRLNLPETNRLPRASEIAVGLPFLQRICALFPNIPVVAMGRVASEAMLRLGITHTRVRHPAQGGAREFAEQLRAVFGA